MIHQMSLPYWCGIHNCRPWSLQRGWSAHGPAWGISQSEKIIIIVYFTNLSELLLGDLHTTYYIMNE